MSSPVTATNQVATITGARTSVSTTTRQARAGRLRIGLVAPPWFAVPPARYGGIEAVVALLADGLADRGHEVTLFASGGSATRARLVSRLRQAAVGTARSERIPMSITRCSPSSIAVASTSFRSTAASSESWSAR